MLDGSRFIRDNDPVIRPRLFWVFALVAVLSTALAPQAFASWVCEGRTCGITLLLCCCTSPDAGRDAKCDTGSRTQSGSSVCPASCECVLTVSNLDTTRPTPISLQVAPAELFALLPVTFHYVAPSPAEELPHLGETRGPPPRVLALGTPTLRGPPSLTFPHIGV